MAQFSLGATLEVPLSSDIERVKANILKTVMQVAAQRGPAASNLAHDVQRCNRLVPHGSDLLCERAADLEARSFFCRALHDAHYVLHVLCLRINATVASCTLSALSAAVTSPAAFCY
jgi:hypothetical protein